MMKRTVLLLWILAVVSSCLTGCDAFRRLAGRPTSGEIEALREAAVQEKGEAGMEASAVPVTDSLAAADTVSAADTILSQAVSDSLNQLKGTVLNRTAVGGLYTTKLDYQYYVVVGAFRWRPYAESLLLRVNERDYTGTIISFRNGFNAVGICPTDDLNEALRALSRVREEAFCPEDVWILVNR